MKAWKYICILLLLATLVGGLLLETPRLPILNETIRNLYFHVPMWFGMIALLFLSCWYSVRYLRSGNPLFDIWANSYAVVGIVFGILGLVTGMLWAKYTWGSYWSGDPKQNASAIGLLMYFAYTILRGSFTDSQMRARISAVYNILAFSILIPLLFILPRLTDSLHPGNGGNPGFNAYDLDNRMRLIFYPANIGWIMLGIWIAQLIKRITLIEQHQEEIKHL